MTTGGACFFFLIYNDYDLLVVITSCQLEGAWFSIMLVVNCVFIVVITSCEQLHHDNRRSILSYSNNKDNTPAVIITL